MNLEIGDLVRVLIGNQKTQTAIWKVKHLKYRRGFVAEVEIRMLPPHKSPDMTRSYRLEFIHKLSALELLAREAE